MLPSQPQLTGKRKPDESNPLLHAAAAKRAKKEAKLGATAKRKLNTDEGQGGLLIVRAPEFQFSSQPATSTNAEQLPPRFSSQPTTAASVASSSKPPSKKFRADSQPPTARPRAMSQTKSGLRTSVAFSTVHEDFEVENDVRAMEDEADHLRRNSRVHTTIDVSLLSANPAFQPEPSRTKRKSKITDISTPLPDDETSKIERNKQLRSGAMAAIKNGRTTSETNGRNPAQGHRRKSSVGGRGKRISNSFEATGIITQPHNSVSDNSFYKHIDCDLPEPERMRQLLIWSASRAAATPTGSTSSTSKASSSSSSTAPPLPLLSAQAAQTLKSVQEDVVRMLAEKRIDMSLYSSGASSSKTRQEDLRENEQNVRNRQWEVTYTDHIQKAQAEEEAWKKLSYGYDTYAKKLQTSLEKRSAALQDDPQVPSAKAKGKRRATGDVSDLSGFSIPHEHELPPEFHPALSLARSVVGQPSTGDDRIAGSGMGGRGVTRSGMSRDEMEAELKRRLPDLEFKIDQIFTFASAARATTNIGEKALNERYDIISAHLASRLNPHPPSLPRDDSASGSTREMLATYVAPSGATKVAGANPLDLMRALTKVDQERPPAMVGDAARRAAREVQRAGESGVGAVGDRRLTGFPTTPSRKAPGTPRRGNTPGRDR
ncbi:Mis12-Mtw1 protein family-domain-containing protein [Crassisporium funariophilum]|nr:Mis12-Mtw1 protein family-domain-containing protein [Crassisporium funariophilum]